ncbi:MAG: hypothetical protein IPP42_05270 [Saprospiraceae bacterium]|nr:hypothetical protein [Saprospiraceae bacterium]
MLGAAGSGAHFNMLKNKDCQVLIVGESNEWETVPYVQDAISKGQQRALIVWAMPTPKSPVWYTVETGSKILSLDED